MNNGLSLTARGVSVSTLRILTPTFRLETQNVRMQATICQKHTC